MNVIKNSSLAIIAVPLLAGPNPTQGDYYAPSPTTPIHPSAADLKRNAAFAVSFA
jgi:hypothetical protein